MKILNKDFINAFPYKILNIHPSILPKFKGLNTHKRALESGVKYHGATVHFVEEDLDSGPIIMQYKIAVNKNDDEETLKNRVHKGEYLILVETIKLFIMKDLKIDNNSIIIDGVPLHNPILYEESI
jgi:phosphoribosylglycinamide formyltransferase-1